MIDKWIPLDVFQSVVFDYCDGNDQINLKKIFYDGKLQITDLLYVDDCVKKKLCDDSLKHYPRLKRLDASSNELITDCGIRGLGLRALDARHNPMITDKGIQGMNLHTLYASFNPLITDRGIQGMNLHTLYASNDSSITDRGI